MKSSKCTWPYLSLIPDFSWYYKPWHLYKILGFPQNFLQAIKKDIFNLRNGNPCFYNTSFELLGLRPWIIQHNNHIQGPRDKKQCTSNQGVKMTKPNVLQNRLDFPLFLAKIFPKHFEYSFYVLWNMFVTNLQLVTNVVLNYYVQLSHFLHRIFFS